MSSEIDLNEIQNSQRNWAGDTSRLFEPVAELTAEWFAYLKSLPLDGSRKNFNDGESAWVDARRPNGVDVIKYNDIFIAPTANITFGPSNPQASGYPRAFFIICKKMILRPRGGVPVLRFIYSEARSKPSKPPRPINIGGHTGIDGTNGAHGFPSADLHATDGPPIYIIFNELELRDAEPNLNLVDIFAQGAAGQPGGDGGDGGGCTGGYCRDHPGVGGIGGNGGYGTGGGTVYIYAPNAPKAPNGEGPLDMFYNHSEYHLGYGLGAQGGIGGWDSGRFCDTLGCNNEHVQSPSGSHGNNGNEGDVWKIEKNNVLSLFSPARSPRL